jgi:hypothetical protein
MQKQALQPAKVPFVDVFGVTVRPRFGCSKAITVFDLNAVPSKNWIELKTNGKSAGGR